MNKQYPQFNPITEMFGNYALADKKLCEEWDNNIPGHVLESFHPELLFLSDSQEIDSICEYFSFLPREEITGIQVAIGEGEYTEIYITEYSAPYNVNAIWSPLDYYL